MKVEKILVDPKQTVSVYVSCLSDYPLLFLPRPFLHKKPLLYCCLGFSLLAADSSKFTDVCLFLAIWISMFLSFECVPLSIHFLCYCTYEYLCYSLLPTDKCHMSHSVCRFSTCCLPFCLRPSHAPCQLLHSRSIVACSVVVSYPPNRSPLTSCTYAIVALLV